MVDVSVKASGSSSQILSQWAERKQRWAALEQAVAGRQLKSAESSAQHTQLLAELLALNLDLLDEFGLSLDPQADSYFMIMASFANAPGLAEKLGQMRARGTGFLATGSLPTAKFAAPALVLGCIAMAQPGSQPINKGIQSEHKTNCTAHCRIRVAEANQRASCGVVRLFG